MHGDVFRFPNHKLIFCAYVGLGAQLLCIAALILMLAIIGSVVIVFTVKRSSHVCNSSSMYYPNNGGAMYTSLIVIFALTSVIGGFVAGRLYAQMGGTNWSWNLVATGLSCRSASPYTSNPVTNSDIVYFAILCCRLYCQFRRLV